MHGPGCVLPPAAAKRLPSVSTLETTLSRASIVWILPFTSSKLRPSGQSALALVFAPCASEGAGPLRPTRAAVIVNAAASNGSGWCECADSSRIIVLLPFEWPRRRLALSRDRPSQRCKAGLPGDELALVPP